VAATSSRIPTGMPFAIPNIVTMKGNAMNESRKRRRKHTWMKYQGGMTGEASGRSPVAAMKFMTFIAAVSCAITLACLV
jgi:hypothetical protein